MVGVPPKWASSTETGASTAVVIEQGERRPMGVLVFGGGWLTVMVPPVQIRKKGGRGSIGWMIVKYVPPPSFVTSVGDI